MDYKYIFEKHLAQSSSFFATGLDIDYAEGIYIFDKKGKQYTDLISGVAVNNLGHRHPVIIEAIEKQLKRYLHLMVYGEFPQKESIELVAYLKDILPPELSVTFLVNSGSEAIEGAMKLSRLFTGRKEIISFKGSYHGSTLGALNLLGDEHYKRPFRPLIPFVRALVFNDMSQLNLITEQTACVIMEPVQTASGMVLAEEDFFKKLRQKCTETGTLLVFDEIQTALGRTGKLFAFQTFGIQPDVLCLAKSLGGGLPVGAFISSPQIMKALNNGHPLLGHATTFGGHPLCCATALATIKFLKESSIVREVLDKEALFRKHLRHKMIKKIDGRGLLLACDLGDERLCRQFVERAFAKGLITYWFLFNKNAFGILPPLIITKTEIEKACRIIIEILDEL